jgi:ribosomal protein L35
MKGNKSYSKRLRVTKHGKIVARAAGQNHFNAKGGGAKRMRHKRAGSFHAALSASDKSRFFPSSH